MGGTGLSRPLASDLIASDLIVSGLLRRHCRRQQSLELSTALIHKLTETRAMFEQECITAFDHKRKLVISGWCAT